LAINKEERRKVERGEYEQQTPCGVEEPELQIDK
jgi:hypothetical protein